MSSDIPQSIVDKLQKLVSMKERPGSEGEAANAAFLIQQLCTKYNIDMNVLERPEEQEAVQKGLDFTQRLQTYDTDLAHVVDLVCDTKHFLAIRHERKFFKNKSGRPDFKMVTAKSIVFVGLPANVETAVLVWNYLDKSIYAMMDRRFKRGELKGLSDHRAYRMGAAQRLLEICRLKKEEYLDNVEPDCKAVVLMSQSVAQQALDNMKKDGSLKGTHKPNGDIGRSWGAYARGHADGAEIDPHGARKSKMLE